ncbi:cell division protein Cdc14 [Gorgonomyces haynaldii]|nr:cell division protein Cdc14 [Gorgonomyces haynaldii]
MSLDVSFQVTKGLKTLRQLLKSLSTDEERLFAIIQTQNNCEIQRLLFDLVKKLKSPTALNQDSQLLLVFDLIQGVSLMHYESKKLVLENQRLNLLLTCLSVKDHKLLVSVMEALSAILVDSCQNLRLFEQQGGLHLVASLVKTPHQTPEAIRKCIELFGIYLSPEDYPDAIVDDVNYKRAVSEKQLELKKIMGNNFVEQLIKTLK